jgi:DNA modification methylase
LIRELPEFDYCVTSPPYHNILRNKGGGVRHDGSQTRQGVEYYSEYPDDLGNQESYQEYLKLLQEIFKEVYKKLRNNKYCTIIISDFTVDKQETNAHGDVINVISDIGFTFIGTIVLVQDSKVLYPFGYPYQFRINHVHQYILNFLKNG